jgi:hypothetical protein
MADDGLRIGVCVMGVSVHNAGLPQVAEATLAKTLVIARWQVTAELVNGYLQDKLGLVRGMDTFGTKKGRYGKASQDNQSSHIV